MKIIVAIDSFKGCLTSAEANQAAAKGLLLARPDAEVIQVPVSDGGEGWTEAFQAAWESASSLSDSGCQPVDKGEMVELCVSDPLMRPIVAQYLVRDDTAVIEMAKASGLTLLTHEERNPLKATTYGTGQLVVDAVRRGCRHIIAGLGGSATSDCGMGMLRAIINGFSCTVWDDVYALEGIHFTIATDVTNPLCGENGAAHVFAPQKGATPEMVHALDVRARRFAEASALHFGYDRQNEPGAGAAGGLGYAFLQYLNAECRPGIDLLMDAANFDSLLKGVDLVVTGEGSADRQTLMGKLPYGILQHARTRNTPVVLIAGQVKDRQQLLNADFARVECINPPGLPLEEAMMQETAKRNISTTMQRLFSNSER